MPIYDYVCESCGRVLEIIHGVHEEGPEECPDCGGPMTKAFAAPTIHFRGSGWAKKDRRSTSGPVRSNAPSADGSTSGPSAVGSAGGDPGTSDGGGSSASGD